MKRLVSRLFLLFTFQVQEEKGAIESTPGIYTTHSTDPIVLYDSENEEPAKRTKLQQTETPSPRQVFPFDFELAPIW
jgi:hypothetical protein